MLSQMQRQENDESINNLALENKAIRRLNALNTFFACLTGQLAFRMASDAVENAAQWGRCTLSTLYKERCLPHPVTDAR